MFVVFPKFMLGEVLIEDAMIMFIAMLAGPSLAGIIMIIIIDGKTGLRKLLKKMLKWRVELYWYLVVFIPPILIFSILILLSRLVSPVFTPSLNIIGLGVGVLAGFFEEIGWTGFVLPKMQEKYNSFHSSLILGLLWGLWHLLAGFLGSTVVLEIFLLRFVVMFIFAMIAIRFFIVWVYKNTESVLLAILIHASSTGFLYILSPAPISPINEILWYIIYTLILWVFVIKIYSKYGKQLKC